MEFESTKGKTCLSGAMIEVQTNGNSLFMDISICDVHCAKFNKKYMTCWDIIMQTIELDKYLKDDKYKS